MSFSLVCRSKWDETVWTGQQSSCQSLSSSTARALPPRPIPSFCHILWIPSPLSLSPQVERQPVSFLMGSRSELSTISPVTLTEILPVRMLRDTASSVSEWGRAGFTSWGWAMMVAIPRMTQFQPRKSKVFPINTWKCNYAGLFSEKRNVQGSGITSVLSASLKTKLKDTFPRLPPSTMYKGCNKVLNKEQF